MYGNNTQEAYTALTDAESYLFTLSQGSTVEQQFVPLRDQIEQSENALLGNDTMKALDRLNAASVELLKLTQKLPSGEEPEGD